MLKKLAVPFLICSLLTAAGAGALVLLVRCSFFDGTTQFLVLLCLGLLFLAVWAAFLGEYREIRAQLAAEAQAAEAEAARLAGEELLQQKALHEAAQLISGDGSREEPPAP